MGKNYFLEPGSNPHYNTAHQSHMGHVRAGNEDRLAVREFTTTGLEATPVLLAVLADGVGGHRAGEIAAQIGVDAVVDTLATCETLSEPALLLQEAFHEANRLVLAHATAHPETQGMGSTCVCVLLIRNQLYMANLGDSRVYILQGEDFKQFSFDHTWLTDASEVITSELQGIGRDNPMAHILTRYLGSLHPITVDLRMRLGVDESVAEMQKNQGMRMNSGDRVLLCSDGLTDMLDDGIIRKLVASNPLEKAAETLLNAALTAGGHDNISLILIQLP
jgi:serine/threonine protein phosphatase PrpC